MYYVYILFSKKLDKKYIGFTQDIPERLRQHNNRKVPFTSNGIPWQLIYYEVFRNKKDAMEEEKFLKSGKGRERLAFLLSHTLQDIQTDR
jgi:putative endonuclease